MWVYNSCLQITACRYELYSENEEFSRYSLIIQTFAEIVAPLGSTGVLPSTTSRHIRDENITHTGLTWVSASLELKALQIHNSQIPKPALAVKLHVQSQLPHHKA